MKHEFTQKQYRDFGLFGRAAITREKAAIGEAIEAGLVLKAASETQGPAGGFLVPTELGTPLQALLEHYGVFRRYANVVPMRRDTKDNPRRTGGVTVYAPGEGGQITASNAAWGNVHLSAVKMAALIKISSEADEDATDLGMELADEFARAMAQQEDVIGFTGDGTSASFGKTGIATLLQDGAHAGGVTAVAGHDLFSEIDATDIGTLIAKLPVRAMAGAAWYVSQVGYGLTVCRLAASSGGIQVINGEPHWMGFPVRLTPALPAVTTSLTGRAMILLGDLRLAAILGDRKQLAIASSSTGTTFEFDQTQVRGIERVDLVTNDLGDATNAGAMVALIGA
jgi:HK97 family phage major capsid protein